MTRDGHPPRVDPRARMTIIILVIVFVVGLVVALAVIDSRRASTGGQPCPNALDSSCGGRNGGGSP
jgi:hypothetical protein